MRSAPMRSARPSMVDVWSYSTLLREMHEHSIVSASLLPDASLRMVDAGGVAHSTQLIPAQVPGVLDRLVENDVDVRSVAPTAASELLRTVLSLVPYVMVLLVGLSVVGRGGGFGKNGIPGMTSEPTFVSDVETTFSEVAGLATAKEELFEVVEYLRDPDRFAASGAKAPRGVLLEGPPGTGKTLLARAVAGEAGVPFLPVTASSFVEMYVGLGAARVRGLFAKAKSHAPCIVWIDEIDAVAKQRTGAGGTAGNEERETTLNELLSAMDGFEKDTGVLVLAATNRADVLDEALLRPGRFDRRVAVTLPDVDERASILEVHARGKIFEEDLDVRDVAAQTAGFSGAALENLLNEAAIRALRRNTTVVSRDDVNEALDRVVAGLPRARVPDRTVRERVAVHEAGHVIVGSVLEDHPRVTRVTIVPRASGAGGFTAFAGDDARAVDGLYTRDYLLAQMAVLLGGRAAEELFLGRDTVSVGASSDLKRVREIAQRMVTEWGMGDTLVSYADRRGASTQDDIDRQIEELVDEAYQRALGVLNAHSVPLSKITGALIEANSLTGEDVEGILRA